MFNLLIDIKFRVWGIDLGHFHHVYSGGVGFPIPQHTQLVNFSDRGVLVSLSLDPATV